MFDFNDIPFFDNHAHLINYDHKRRAVLTKNELDASSLCVEFLHGRRDVLPVNNNGKFGISPELLFNLQHLGVVRTLVHSLSQYFGCVPTMEAVLAKRNERTSTDLVGYTKELYRDQNIIAVMVDDGSPMGDPSLDCFPCRTLRLFQMDPQFQTLLKECRNYDELAERHKSNVQQAATEGFSGIKSHVLELVSTSVRIVEHDEAEDAFEDARAGMPEALDTVYLAAFTETMRLCRERNLPVHIHTGCTGNPNDLLGNGCDPFRMIAFLNEPEFYNVRVVFLHGSYPNLRNAALMTHCFPHVWVDLSWSLPWISLNFAQCLLEVLGVASHAKILLGSGQHGIPEISWLAAKTAKSALSAVMEELVQQNLLAESQARETAEFLLYKNAARLYALNI